MSRQLSRQMYSLEDNCHSMAGFSQESLACGRLARMTWLLIKMAIRLVVFVAVFWFSARHNPKIRIQPRWATPLVAGLFAVLNVGLYWLLKPVLNLATFNVAWFAMPLVLNLIFLLATVRAFQTKKWLEIDGVRATLWLALILTAAHCLLYAGLDYIPAKV